VPAGKVLLIEHLITYFQTASTVVVEIAAPAENKANELVTTGWQFNTVNRQTYTLARPLRANAGSAVKALPNNVPNNGEIYVEGLLVDQADLYAANLDVKVEGVSLAQGRLTETVRLTSPRPAIFNSIVSSDLRNWVDNLSQIVTKSAQPGVYDISTQLASSEFHKFLSASAKTAEIP
ncbi:MAG TPA: hypothetical protein VG095_07685, partial [Chthoniobacterales bacterium]|nr:hypothetical protein [Chthoniobacterales bacterium]